MATFTVEVSQEELKALEWDIVDIEAWVQNAISNKARKMVDRAVEMYTDKQPSKMTWEDKLTTVSGLDLPKASAE